MLRKAGGGLGFGSQTPASNKWAFAFKDRSRLHLLPKMSKICCNEPVAETRGLIERLPAETASLESCMLG